MIIFSLEISNNSHSTGKTDFASTIKEKRKKTPRLCKYSIIESFLGSFSNLANMVTRESRNFEEKLKNRACDTEIRGRFQGLDHREISIGETITNRRPAPRIGRPINNAFVINNRITQAKRGAMGAGSTQPDHRPCTYGYDGIVIIDVR